MNMQPERIPTQTATIIGEGQSNGKNYSGDKRLLSCFTVLAQYSGERSNHDVAEVVTVRTYGGIRPGGSRNYVSLWATGYGKYLAGHGQAGGWGYHRPSAAAQNAFESAGVKLSEAQTAGAIVPWNPQPLRSRVPWASWETCISSATGEGMAHTYKAFGRQIWRDGKPFAVLASVAHGTEDLRDDFGDGMIQVIAALRESLDAMERMDARLLAYSNGAAQGAKGEVTRARAALKAIGAI